MLLTNSVDVSMKPGRTGIEEKPEIPAGSPSPKLSSLVGDKFFKLPKASSNAARRKTGLTFGKLFTYCNLGAAAALGALPVASAVSTRRTAPWCVVQRPANVAA